MDRIALLFEPHPETGSQMAGWLSSRGWTVRQAESPAAAWAVLQAEPVVVCLMATRWEQGALFDWMLRVRREFPHERQPILLARLREGEPGDYGRAMDAGADVVLGSEWDASALEGALEQQLKRSLTPTEMTIRFWGVRGSIPTPGPKTVRVGGNTSCIELRAEGELIILDAGTGIRLLGLDLQEEYADRPLDATLLITHTHWDHIQGFPFFAPAYKPGNHLRILGYEGSRRGLEGTLSGQMESAYFPVSLRSVPSELEFREMQDLTFQIGRVSVQSTFAHHPGICMGYRLQTAAGSVVYLPDHEVYSRESILQMAKFEHTAGSDELAGHAREQDEKITRFIQGADLLIMDTQYLTDEYPRYVGWGHSCVDDVVETAVAGDVKRLRLFHHDPAHDDDRLEYKLRCGRDVAASLGSDIEIELAREGDEVRLTGK